MTDIRRALGLKWQDGRQGGGYQKLKIFESKLLKCDCYLIRYKVGQGVKVHKDEVPYHRHWRVNVLLKRAKSGGTFFRWTKDLLKFDQQSRVVVFRPDMDSHGVTPVAEGERLVLSFGVAL